MKDERLSQGRPPKYLTPKYGTEAETVESERLVGRVGGLEVRAPVDRPEPVRLVIVNESGETVLSKDDVVDAVGVLLAATWLVDGEVQGVEEIRRGFERGREERG